MLSNARQTTILRKVTQTQNERAGNSWDEKTPVLLVVRTVQSYDQGLPAGVLLVLCHTITKQGLE